MTKTHAFVVIISKKQVMFHQCWQVFGPSRQTLKVDAAPTIFSFNSPPKRRKLSEARQAKAQHRDLVEGLLEASCSAIVESVREVTTRDIGTQTGKLIFFILMYITAIVDFLVLTRSAPQFMDIYPDTPTQHDVGTQANMLLATSSPKQLSPAPAVEVTTSFCDEDLM